MPPCVSSTAVRDDAFSLVESAVALGVVAFVLVALVGVWPSGQGRLRGAMDMTIAAHLAQRISAEVEQANFPDVLSAANLAAGVGSLPRRYFSYDGREVKEDDPARVYEVLTRAVHRQQLPLLANGTASRWNAQGQLVLTIEVVTSPAGMQTPVSTDGLVDRVRCRQATVTFPLIVGGNASW